jgi:DNA-directed RNA polymerase specialized sigma24 family protein
VTADAREASAPTWAFGLTRWTLVAAAGAQDPASARRALIELCLRYWRPVYSLVRSCGHAPNAAQDIVRSFFEYLLQRAPGLPDRQARGRFREYLLSELTAFLDRDWRELSEPAPVAELDRAPDLRQLEERHRFEPGADLSPQQSYVRGCAVDVLFAAAAGLREEARQSGHLRMFEAMEPFLSEDPTPAQREELARRLGIRPLATVIALKRLRQRFRELARAELAETVASAADLETERRTLAAALGVL